MPTTTRVNGEPREAITGPAPSGQPTYLREGMRVRQAHDAGNPRADPYRE
jgi:hypothetical protein